ncbi:molybdopterin-guanine dinucleotide biosynthesis protein B [Fuerstiella marisgermanici]|uniref:Molybdopterin-guanine dinucleotide biosynthesis protein B n=1 Tax=Fuerstiella marisgermanici TaxID=1891926 RepID=A0A1P8WHD0_9PLAN|nr:molybdopterin-guanine dinucleotide biosynthesis protein B [Fuerstiella marisgermanici]APZ93476.1 Molybdopterin-guanine dinucleotide biosynthesis protein B [Fuerstiella marisgermanici]
MMHPKRQTVPRIHIVGRKNAGKTTLVCDLVKELTRMGYRVATIKHTHHNHELDTPGKDSHQHRESGATGVGILSPQITAAFVPVQRNDDEAKRYDSFQVLFADSDLILVEGDLQTTATRIEVWRETVPEPPYATTDKGIAVVVSDNDAHVSCLRWPRKDIGVIANNVADLAGIAVAQTRSGAGMGE